jgi:hypothetical protein
MGSKAIDAKRRSFIVQDGWSIPGTTMEAVHSMQRYDRCYTALAASCRTWAASACGKFVQAAKHSVGQTIVFCGLPGCAAAAAVLT